MRIVIMGCGRVGERVAKQMDEEGHNVAVIDCDPLVRSRLGPGFKGLFIKGVGFDRDVLIAAGIEQADAFAATSSSDNANIIAARIARNIFRVPRVIARLYDPRRAEIYHRLGLLTISSTEWGAERIREMLLHSELDPRMTFGSGEVCLLAIEASQQLAGRMVRELSIPGEVSVAAITRKGKAFIPTLGSEFRAGDMIHLIIQAEAMDRFKELLGMREGGF